MFSWTSGSEPLNFMKVFYVDVNVCYYFEIDLIYLNVLTSRDFIII